MDIQQAFKMAFKSLMSSKLRSLLTMLGIIIGVAAVIAIMSIGQGLMNKVNDMFSNLGANIIEIYIGGRGSSRTITVDDMYQLVNDNPDLLCDLSPMANLPGGIKLGNTQYDSTGVQGVSEAYNRLELLDIEQGRFLQYIDIARRENVCVVGSYVDKEIFEGKALGNTLKIMGQEYTVVGVVAESYSGEEGSGDDFVYIPYVNAAKMGGNANISAYGVNATSKETTAAAVALLKEFIEERMNGSDFYYVESLSEMLEQEEEMLNIIVSVLSAIAGISLLVGGIGIMNIMLVSVTERTREIGIRKSLGARRRDIRLQFLIEAASTSAIGGMLGIVLGIILGYVGGVLLDFRITPTLSPILLSFSISVGIGIIFGYLPANKAAKLNPIDALRYD